MPKFLREHAIEPNSRQRYAEVLRSHAVPYIGHRRVAEISRETFHRLLTVVLKDEGVGPDSALRDDADGLGPRIPGGQSATRDPA